MIVTALLCFALCACALASGELPWAEDAELYDAFAAELSALGFDVREEDVMSIDVNNYDGVDYTAVAYTPIDGLAYNLDYENASLYMVFLTIAPDTEAYARADEIVLALLRLLDSDDESDGSETDFIAQLRADEDMRQRGDYTFQIIDYSKHDGASMQDLTVMVYFN